MTSERNTTHMPDVSDPGFLNGVMQAPSANECRLVQIADARQQEIERLRAALTRIVGTTMSVCLSTADLAQRRGQIAQEALDGK